MHVGGKRAAAPATVGPPDGCRGAKAMNLLLPPGARRPIPVEILGKDGPGTACGPYEGIEVSVQVGRAWEGAVPGDVRVSPHDDAA